MTEKYQYRPLGGHRNVRILKLDIVDSPELTCTFVEGCIDKAFTLYEAASYTWGSAERPHSLVCEGKQIAITANCDAMLRDFRAHYHDSKLVRKVNAKRHLWIDSICINQGDQNEKTQQIRLMGEIYRNASEVVVWLGPSTPESDLCFDVVVQYNKASRWPSFTGHKQKRQEDALAALHPKAMLDVLLRSWFGRVWTIQETVMGRWVQVRCGDRHVGLETMLTCLIPMLTRFFTQARYPLTVVELTTRSEYRLGFRRTLHGKQKKFNVINLLSEVRQSGAQDLKDKVFALYDMFRGLGIKIRDPDYTRSVSEIYQNATTTVIRHTSDLHILTMVTGTGNAQLGLPSWVPDYSEDIPPWPVWYSEFRAAGDIQAYFDFEGSTGSVLSVCGKIVDRVTSCSTLGTWHPDRLIRPEEDLVQTTLEAGEAVRTIQALQDWARTAIKLSGDDADDLQYRPTGQNIEEAFFSTLYTNRMSASFHKALEIALLAKDFDRLVAGGYSTTKINKPSAFWGILMANTPEEAGSDDWRVWLEDICRASSEECYATRKQAGSDKAAWEGLATSSRQDEEKILLALSILKQAQSVLMTARKNTFFVTEKGYMGTGPRSIRDGDRVVLVPSVSVPLIVRPAAQRRQVPSGLRGACARHHEWRAGQGPGSTVHEQRAWIAGCWLYSDRPGVKMPLESSWT